MATEGEKIGRLRDFFLDAFTVSELEMFLTVNGYGEVVATVNQRAGGMEYFFAVAQALERRGEIDGEFFERLRKERPKKATPISVLRPLWLAEDQAVPKPLGRTASQGASVAPDGNEPETFDFDVFLSHSSKDKPVVRALAERLKRDGLKVWFDEWEVRPGDSIYSRVRDGLERSRILLLFMSRNVFGSDWAALEHQAILFRDPLNRKRRFIPLRLDDADIPAVLRQFRYLDWQTPTDDAYRSLLLACRAPTPASQRGSTSFRPASGPRPPTVMRGHTGPVLSVAISSNGRRAVSGSRDATVRVWDLETSACAAVLERHKDKVYGVAISADGRRAVSGSDDQTVRVWDLETSACTAVLQGHTRYVYGVAVTSDGRRAVSSSYDTTVRVWDVDSGACDAILQGHTALIHSVAVTADGRRAVSGSHDKTVRVWDVDSGACAAVLKGHEAQVWGVAVTADGRRAVSGSLDKTVRVWDVDSGTCAVLQGHESEVYGVAVTPDGRRAVSGSSDRTVRMWDLDSGACTAVLNGHAGSVYGVAVTPDGRRAISGSDDQTVRMWDLQDILAAAEKY